MKGGNDYIPLGMGRAGEYRKRIETVKCRAVECWQKGVLWRTDSEEVRARSVHARDRLLHPVEMKEVGKSAHAVSDSEMTLPPTPVENQAKSTRVRSVIAHQR